VLGAVRHELLASDRLGDLLAACEERAGLAPLDRSELERLGRQRRAAVALPQSLVAAFAATRSHCLAAWEEAREESYQPFWAFAQL
jgi:Zn-dependent M32 family carboxypeptidase